MKGFRFSVRGIVGFGMAPALLSAVLLCAACGRKEAPDAARLQPRVEDMSWGPIQVTFSADPATVQLDQDVFLTIKVVAPSEMDVTLPPLVDRLEGFTLNAAYDDEPVTRDGKTARVHHVRLTPILAADYRLAPIAIEYKDKAVSPPQSGWFPTRPILFESLPPFAGDAGKTIRARLEPVWIYPPFKVVLLYVVLAAAMAGAGVIVWKLLRRVKEGIAVRRMSPKERALRELEQLLAKDLIGKHFVKEFYLELTMIVRRYVERRHAIRAPEQTTEEFLAAVTRDPRFTPDVVRKLKAFLESADLVKFAAYQPSDGAVAVAMNTAREYVVSDADAAGAVAEGVKGGSGIRIQELGFGSQNEDASDEI